MSQVVSANEPDHLGLLVAGWVMAFVLPIGGVIAAFAIGEKRVIHSVLMAFVATLMGFVWAWLLFAA